MATLESLQATLALYEAERDRILTNGASYGADGATRESSRLETLTREISILESRIAIVSGSRLHANAVFGGRG